MSLRLTLMLVVQQWSTVIARRFPEKEAGAPTGTAVRRSSEAPQESHSWHATLTEPAPNPLWPGCTESHFGRGRERERGRESSRVMSCHPKETGQCHCCCSGCCYRRTLEMETNEQKPQDLGASSGLGLWFLGWEGSRWCFPDIWQL